VDTVFEVMSSVRCLEVSISDPDTVYPGNDPRGKRATCEHPLGVEEEGWVAYAVVGAATAVRLRIPAAAVAYHSGRCGGGLRGGESMRGVAGKKVMKVSISALSLATLASVVFLGGCVFVGGGGGVATP
jgi:hypothetical protein